MAPGRRDGGGWERHRDWPAAPPYWIKLDAQQIYRLAIQVVQSAVAFRTRPPRLRVTQSRALGPGPAAGSLGITDFKLDES